MKTIELPPKEGMFRTARLAELPSKVDRKANIIFGANLMQVGDLNDGDSRPWTIDAEALAQAQQLMSKGNNGAKARFTHPNMSSDGMGSYLGRWKNVRVDGGTLRGDLHLADAAFTSPQGDLGTYVMDLAESDPEAFGVSLATMLDRKDLDAHREKSKEAKWPMRFSDVRAGDIVDEPAATRGGMFDLTTPDLRNLPAQATALLATYFGDAEPEVVTARVNGFLATYFKTKGHHMAEPTPATEPQQPAAPPAEPATPSPANPVDLSAERAAAADLARKDERERVTTITALCKQAGKPELADKFCENGSSVADVQGELFQMLCKSNSPVGEEGGTGETDKPDENKKYKAEFKEGKYRMTEEQYVSLRRAEDGLEEFIPKKK